MVGFIVNSNRTKFVIRTLIVAGLCGVDINDISAVEDFFTLRPSLLKALFDNRIYPSPTVDEYQQLLSTMHPYALLYSLSNKERIIPVLPLMQKSKNILDHEAYSSIATVGSKYFSIYIADTAQMPLIPKDSFVEIKTKESRVSGKLLNMLFVTPESVIAFDATDCAKTIFSVIENFKSYYCAYWKFDIDTSLVVNFASRQILSRAYTNIDKEFVPKPNIGVTNYSFVKGDMWNLPNMFADVHYLADINFSYSYREIKGKIKGPLIPAEPVHKNILSNIPVENGNPIDVLRKYIAYHWFFKELPDATMDIFTDLSAVSMGDEFIQHNRNIVNYYVNAILNLVTTIIKKQENLPQFEEKNINAVKALCNSSDDFILEILSEAEDNYQYFIDTVPIEKMFSV